MRPACAVAGAVLNDVATWVKPGVTTKEIDSYAASRIKHYGGKSAFLGYRKYPCQICISVNDEVVHGLAGPRVLRFGDIVCLDVGVFYHGFVGDTARTVAVLSCSNSRMIIGLKLVIDDCAQSIDDRRSPGCQSRRPTKLNPEPLNTLA